MMRCAGIHDSQNGVVNALSARISAWIKTDTHCEFSDAHISSVLRRMMAQTVIAFPFTGADSWDASRTERISILVIRRIGMTFSIEISRHYLRSILEEHKDVLLSAVISAIDPEFPVDTLLLGRTYRYGYKTTGSSFPQPFPFLFETFDAASHRRNAQPVYLEKDTFRRFAQDILDGDSDPEDCDGEGELIQSYVDERIAITEGVLEDQYLESWCEMNGIPVPAKRSVRHRDFHGHYPRSFIDGYNAEFRNQLGRRSATTTTTTTTTTAASTSTKATAGARRGARRSAAGYGDDSGLEDASTPVSKRARSTSARRGGGGGKRGGGPAFDADY
jgi:hypothetical protein